MSLDPRFLTPAGAKSVMMSQMSAPQMSRPQIDPIRQMSLMPTSPQVEVTPDDEKMAKQMGSDVFGNMDVSNLSDQSIQSMATDNPEDVADEAKDIYNANTEVAQILGAIAKLGDSSEATTKLYNEVYAKEVTPEESRKKVNEFFKVDESKETPVWADVSLSIGLSLLRGEGAKAGDESALGGFLKDLGVAGERGLKVAKERRKEKKARDAMLDKLAFGVYREDEKSRQNLLTQLNKSRIESAEKARELGLKMAKFYQDERKMDETASKNVATAITQTLNTIPNDLRGQAINVISRNAPNFGKQGAANVPNEVYAALKDAGLDLTEVDNAKNIVSAEFKIDDIETFNAYKERFPGVFGSKEFVPGKVYTVKGFSDKGKDGELTSVLSVFTPVGTPSQLGKLQAERSDLANEVFGMPEGPEKEQAKQRLVQYDGAIEKATTRDAKDSYLFDPDGQLRAITSDVDGFIASEAARVSADIERSANNFVRAATIGDRILTALANQPAGAEGGVVGVLGSLSNTINGARGQLNAAIGLANEKHGGDVTEKYTNRNDFAHLYGSKEKTINGQTAGSIFKKFDDLTKDRQELRSAIYDYAFALAGSRETGKLTDKDVANAMITLGGGDVAEGKWFASTDALITGVSSALDLAAAGLAPRWNSTMQKSIDEAVKSGDMSEDEALELYRFDPVRLVKRRAIDPELYKRIQFESGRVRYQNLNRYRGDGAGNLDVPVNKGKINFGTLTPDLRNEYSALESLYIRAQQNPNDQASQKAFDDAVKSITPGLKEVLEKAGIEF